MPDNNKIFSALFSDGYIKEFKYFSLPPSKDAQSVHLELTIFAQGAPLKRHFKSKVLVAGCRR